MTNAQILLAINSLLFVTCFFFVRMWINGLGKNLDKMELALSKKIDHITCTERYGVTKSKCEDMAKHKHAPIRENGEGGEVIIP